MSSDRFGYPLTTASEEAAEHYRCAVDCMLSANIGAADALDAALHADPDFALARAAKARWLQLYMRIPEAQAEAAAARALRDRLTPREARHVEIIALAVDTAGPQALALLDEHVADYPRDALPLSLALGVFGLLGFSGRRDHREAELAILQRLAPHWGEDWYFLTFHGWARIETGDVAAGIAEVERSLSLKPTQWLGRARPRSRLLRGGRRGGWDCLRGGMVARIRSAQPAPRPLVVAPCAVRAGARQLRPSA
jgi:hypothetical protein